MILTERRINEVKYFLKKKCIYEIKLCEKYKVNKKINIIRRILSWK